MDEAGHKRIIVKAINDAGGYARRLEDQYAVGILDTVIIPLGSPLVLFVEFKMVRGLSFGMTPKQFDTAKKITGTGSPNAVPLLIGIKERQLYYCYPSVKTSINEAIMDGERKNVVADINKLISKLTGV